MRQRRVTRQAAEEILVVGKRCKLSWSGAAQLGIFEGILFKATHLISMFQLDHRLQQDCLLVTELSLSLVLLMNDSQYPWAILVPKIQGAREILDLSIAQQQQFWVESACLTRAMQKHYQPDKMNLAALGNVVEQLHVHHIARFRDDIAWPAPVWGRHPVIPYKPEQAADECQAISQLLEELKA